MTYNVLNETLSIYNTLLSLLHLRVVLLTVLRMHSAILFIKRIFDWLIDWLIDCTCVSAWSTPVVCPLLVDDPTPCTPRTDSSTGRSSSKSQRPSVCQSDRCSTASRRTTPRQHPTAEHGHWPASSQPVHRWQQSSGLNDYRGETVHQTDCSETGLLYGTQTLRSTTHLKLLEISPASSKYMH